MTLFCTAAGGWFGCVFAWSRGPKLCNGPRKYEMVLATLVLSTTIGLLMLPVLDQIYERGYHLSG